MKILTELKLRPEGGAGEGPKNAVNPPKLPPDSLPQEAASSRRTLAPDLIPTDEEDLEFEKKKLKQYLEDNKHTKEKHEKHHQQALDILNREGGFLALLAALIEITKSINDTDFKAVIANFGTAVHNLKCNKGEELEYQGIDKWSNDTGKVQQRLDEIEERLKTLKKNESGFDSKAKGAKEKDPPKPTDGAPDPVVTAPVKQSDLASFGRAQGSALEAGGKPKPKPNETPSQEADPTVPDLR